MLSRPCIERSVTEKKKKKHNSHYENALLHVAESAIVLVIIHCWFFKIFLFIYLLPYMGVFGLVQTRGFCLGGVIRPLHLCVPLLLLLKGKVITSRFL